MAVFSTRLLNQATINDGETMDLTQALDLCEFQTLDVVVHVVTAAVGESPLFILEHAAANDTSSYMAFSPPVQVDLTVTGHSWYRITSFTRWIAWRISGSLSSSAMVTIDLLARP